MAPSSSMARTRGWTTVSIVCFAFLACAAGHVRAQPATQPVSLRQPGSATADAAPAMDLPILDDIAIDSYLRAPVSEQQNDKWSTEDALVMSQIIETTLEVAAVEAVVEPLMQYAKIQGMLDTLVTAADAAVHAAEATQAVAASATDAASADIDFEDSLEQALYELDALCDTYASLDEALFEALHAEASQEVAPTSSEAASAVPRPSRRALLQAATSTPPATTTPAAPATTTPTAPAPPTAPVTPTPPATTTTPPATTTTTPPATTTTTTAPAPTTTKTPTPTPTTTPTTTTTTTTPTTTTAKPTTTTTGTTTPSTTTTTPTTTTTTTTTPTTSTTPSAPASPATTDTTDTTTDTTTTSSPATDTTTTDTTTATPAPESSPVVPAKATDVKPNETVPAAVQQEVTTTNSQSNSSLPLPSTEVTISFVLLGTNADGFETKYRQTVLDTVSSISGTTSDQWQSGTSEQSTSGRRLRQTTNLKVDLKILTVNPNLVVYRLAKAPSTAVNGCSSDVCAVLADARVPVDMNSFLIGPASIYNNLFGTADSGTAGNPDAAALQKRRDLGTIVGGSVAGGVVLILIAINYKRFVGCYRSRRAVSAQKKQLKQQHRQNGAAAAVNAAPDASAFAPSKDVNSPNVIGDPIIKHMSVHAERVPITTTGSAVSDGSSSRVSAGGMHATPWVSGLAPQREVVEEVMPDQVPEVHYYESQDLDVNEKPSFYLQRGNTLDTKSADQNAVRHPTAEAVPIYHADSDSFKVWTDQSAAAAVAAAVATGGRRSPQRHTPASSSIVDMAAMLPGSPISSPLHSNKNSYGDLTNPQAHYPPVNPLAIQQTLTQLQNLMQQQQQMMAMMGSVAPGSASGMPQRPAYDRMSHPGVHQEYAGSMRPNFVRQLSTSAPGSRSGSPPFGSPAGTPVAAGAGFQRAGGFALRDVESGHGVGRLGKMDGSSAAASSSRRMRAQSQHGHQDMLATPFASPDLAPFNSK